MPREFKQFLNIIFIKQIKDLSAIIFKKEYFCEISSTLFPLIIL